jgi:hypothetical protein
MALRRTLLDKAAAIERAHELDPLVEDKGSWPGTTLGRRFGRSEAEAGVTLEQARCVVEGL